MSKILVEIGNFHHRYSKLTLEVTKTGDIRIHMPDGNKIYDWHFWQPEGEFDGIGTEFIGGISEEDADKFESNN